MIRSTGKRKIPYTEEGIKRMACQRCGKPSSFQWQICSDGNVFRPICLDCDIELNETVLRFMNFPDWQEKMARYREQVKEELNKWVK